MYRIRFNLYKKKEYLKVGLDKKEFVFGDILAKLLKIENVKDAENFIAEFGCYQVFEVSYNGYNNEITEKIISKNAINTIFEEKEHFIEIIAEMSKLKEYHVKPTDNIKINIEDIINNEKYSPKDDEKLLRVQQSNTTNWVGMFTFNKWTSLRLNNLSIGLQNIYQENIQKIKVKNFTDVEESEIKTHTKKNYIFTFTNEYITNDFLALPWLELNEIIKNGLYIKKCKTCGNYYFNAFKSTSKFCYICGPQSRAPGKKSDNDRQRNNIIRNIQRGSLSIKDGNALLLKKGYKPYKPNKKKGK